MGVGSSSNTVERPTSKRESHPCSDGRGCLLCDDWCGEHFALVLEVWKRSRHSTRGGSGVE